MEEELKVNEFEQGADRRLTIRTRTCGRLMVLKQIFIIVRTVRMRY